MRVIVSEVPPPIPVARGVGGYRGVVGRTPIQGIILVDGDGSVIIRGGNIVPRVPIG